MRHTRALAAGSAIVACAFPGSARSADLAVIGGAGPVVPPGFIGLSLEYNTVLRFAGTNPTRVSPPLVRLMRTIAPTGEQPLVLRIGGNTTDDAWWRHGRRTSVLERYALSRTWTAVVSSLLRQSHASVILGLNMAVDRASVAAFEARQLIAQLPQGSISAFELGNEPEVYASFPRLLDAAGRPVYARTPGAWGYWRYRSELRRFIHALRRVRGAIPLAAPSSGSTSWVPSLGKFLDATRADVGLVTYHAYPLLRCHVGPGSNLWPSIAHLLTDRSSHGLASRFARLVQISRRHHVRFRFDEVGSVACGGASGVSDTFAAALWTVDTLFELLRTGAAGVNLHLGSGLVYSPFQLSRRGRTWHAEVGPEAYGTLMFEQAAPAGARLLHVRLARLPGLRAWATRDQARTVRVVLINKDGVASRTILLAVGRNRGPALVQQLQAPSLATTVTSGTIRLGGLTYGRDTTTGLPLGVAAATIVDRRRGRLAIRIPAASAVIVTIHH